MSEAASTFKHSSCGVAQINSGWSGTHGTSRWYARISHTDQESAGFSDSGAEHRTKQAPEIQRPKPSVCRTTFHQGSADEIQTGKY